MGTVGLNADKSNHHKNVTWWTKWFVILKTRITYEFFLSAIFCNSIEILLKCIFRRPTDNVSMLTHWGRVTHICVSKLSIIGSGNGLSSGRCQAIIWTNAGILLIGPLGTNFSEILIEIYTFSFKKMHLKMLSWKMLAFLSRPQCVNVGNGLALNRQ